MEFTRIPVGDPYADHCGTSGIYDLDALWPGWRSFGALPPLDDRSVECAVRAGLAPEWVIDGVETVRRFGGEAVGPLDDADELCGDGPVVVKPRWNPSGLARRVRVANHGSKVTPLSADQMMQPCYSGEHWSVDFAVRDGVPLWGIAAEGEPVQIGEFWRWTVDRRYWLTTQAWNLDKFSGVVNVEMIDTKPIEVHFRPSIEFFPLYGDAAVQAIMEAAVGQAAGKPPTVCGGTMLVVPRRARVVKCRRDLGEHSWRRQLAYIPNPS